MTTIRAGNLTIVTTPQRLKLKICIVLIITALVQIEIQRTIRVTSEQLYDHVAVKQSASLQSFSNNDTTISTQQQPNRTILKGNYVQPKKNDYATQANAAMTEEADDGLEACHVVIENKADYHHEIIESAVLSYPHTTPHLDTKNCSKTKPVIYDFALLNARFGKHDYADLAESHYKFINETEFWTWKLYMDRRLKGHTFERDDGSLMVYGDFIGYEDYDKQRVDMVLDVTCDANPYMMTTWISQGEDRFCISHGLCEECDQLTFNRTCFVSPVMWPESQCSFFPTKLPQFTAEEISLAREKYAGTDEPSDSVRICIMGSGRNHDENAKLFLALPSEKYNMHFHVAVRSKYSRIFTKRQYVENGLEKEKRISYILERDYEGFAKWVSTCDIVLLGVDPKSTPSKFPPSVVGSESQKKLTGPLPMIVAYKIPTVVHVEFEKLYHDYFRGPVGVYNDTFDSYLEALTVMMKEIYQNKRISSSSSSSRGG